MEPLNMSFMTSEFSVSLNRLTSTGGLTSDFIVVTADDAAAIARVDNGSGNKTNLFCKTTIIYSQLSLYWSPGDSLKYLRDIGTSTYCRIVEKK